ncbi:phasin family protein, partial [Acinetobacter baumannii]
TAALKSFASVKSPTELFQLQSDYARSSFDALVAETSKTTEAMLKLAGEVFQPISNRFAVAAEKIKTAA